MTKEEKQVLFKDLCARLPYGVKYNYDGNEGCDYTMDRISQIAVDDAFPLEDIKPYLRPMSSMTDEEKEEFEKVMRSCTEKILDCPTNERWYQFFDAEEQDFMNAHHFDYRGLIPMGLALEAKEGMYK